MNLNENKSKWTFGLPSLPSSFSHNNKDGGLSHKQEEET